MKTRIYLVLSLIVAGFGMLSAQPAYFTRIANGPSDADHSWGGSLFDYDNDGLVDLFAANWPGYNCLYHNDGNFQFSKVTTEPVVKVYGECATGVCADFDNDGDLDLFATGHHYRSSFFRNDLGAGNSTIFTEITNQPWLDPVVSSIGAAWGDYDSDGFVDLAVVNAGSQDDFLYRNDGAGGMIPVSTPLLTSSGGQSQQCSWADYDGDGDLDLFVVNSFNENNFLFRNEGGGIFTRVLEGPMVNATGIWVGLGWADYDNDGDLDLYICDGSGKRALCQNSGDGTFTAVEGDPVVERNGNPMAAAWGDFDNDGFLDLFVVNYLGFDFLYHNERNGTFTRIYDGDIVNLAGHVGCSPAWADLDNDGFLDLMVANDGPENGLGAPNDLWRNDAKANGNANGWLLVKLVGTASNRSAIGAKIRAKATIWGEEVWQLREISGGNGSWGQADLRAHFGLGDAAQVDLLRIEWPSGIVQEISNVTGGRLLTVTEHQDGATNAPSLAMSSLTDGTVQLTATGQADLRYVFEGSTDLAQWTKLAVRTNLTGTVDYTPSTSASSPQFYRVVVP